MYRILENIILDVDWGLALLALLVGVVMSVPAVTEARAASHGLEAFHHVCR